MVSEEKINEKVKNIVSSLRGLIDNTMSSYIAAEIFYVLSKLNIVIEREEDYLNFVNSLDCSLALKETIIADTRHLWKMIRSCSGIVTKEDCNALIEYFANKSEVDNYSVPRSLIPLVVKVLSNEPGGRMADLACGRGTVLAEAAKEDTSLMVEGVDLNSRSACFAEMLLDSTGGRGRVETDDAFNFVENRFARYDKVFCYPPFGLRMERIAQVESFQSLFPSVFPKIGIGTQSEIMFSLAAMYSLKEYGRAVLLLPEGALFNISSGARAARQFLIEQGYLDTVISLPSKMLERTSIKVSLVVLQKKDDRKSVKMIDASDLAVKGRRFNTIDDEGVTKIVNAVYGFLDNSGWAEGHVKNVDIEEIRANEFVVSADRYFEHSAIPSIECSVRFGDVLKEICRGASVGSKDLDDLVSHEEGACYYLSPANIINGGIVQDLTGMSELPKGAVTCEEGDLLILRTGFPVKTAVFDSSFDKPVVPSANLFICRVDKEKIDPWYLKSFFDSEIGSSMLSSIAVGAAIRSISRKMLEELSVPCPALEKQRKIAAAYREKFDEIKSLESRLVNLRKELGEIYG